MINLSLDKNKTKHRIALGCMLMAGFVFFVSPISHAQTPAGGAMSSPAAGAQTAPGIQPQPPGDQAPSQPAQAGSADNGSQTNAGILPAQASTPVGAAPAAGAIDPGATVNGNATPAGVPAMERPAAAAGTDGQQDNGAAVNKLADALASHVAISPPATRPDSLKTLFFTAWQYALLNEAKQSFTTRPPTTSEANNPDAPRPTGPRELSLGGISFINAKNWTVWLNKQRIKPDAIPKEILDIKVSSDHVDVKWFDNATSLIYPIRLRPQQRFNLDDRLFLPGTGT